MAAVRELLSSCKVLLRVIKSSLFESTSTKTTFFRKYRKQARIGISSLNVADSQRKTAIESLGRVSSRNRSDLSKLGLCWSNIETPGPCYVENGCSRNHVGTVKYRASVRSKFGGNRVKLGDGHSLGQQCVEICPFVYFSNVQKIVRWADARYFRVDAMPSAVQTAKRV